MARVIGEVEVMHKLRAIGGEQQSLIKQAAQFTKGYMIKNMQAVGARKTGLTANSLQPRVISPTKAVIEGSPVAIYIETGTGIYGPRHHRITPVTKRALAFHRGTFGKGGSLRLSGRPRAGAAGRSAQLVVVRSVRGMKARPYIAKSVKEASERVGTDVGAEIVKRWNQAR